MGDAKVGKAVRIRAVGLSTVAKKAVKDAAFFRRLRADPAKALRAAGLGVSGADMRVLKKALKGRTVSLKVGVDAVRLIKLIHMQPKPFKGWIPPTWGGDVPGGSKG